MAKKKPTRKRGKVLADQAVALADYAAKVYIAADELRIKTKPVKEFPLDEDERATVAVIPVLPANLKKKLAKKDSAFTIIDVASMMMAISESVVGAEWREQLLVAMKLRDCLQKNLGVPKGKKAKPTDSVYQFKITLLDSHPPIWRHIQVQDCTLDKLHEHIQTAMGWTNSHLHHFKVGGQLYADPMRMAENFEDMEYKDSTTTTISDLLPKTGKQFRLQYEYDFGDTWYHEVLFEGVVPAEPKVKYPLCVEGARACPPEDVGGVWGYANFVEAIQNPDNEQHDEMLKWIGGRFDPEGFDPAKTTKTMKKGLPDWRSQSRR